MSLQIKGLNVSIDGNQILKDVDLEVEDGEFFCLLGSSGCGKSTLLKTIAGLVQEEDGEIYHNGKALHVLPPQKRGLVIMFQDRRLFSNMDVAENVAFALRNKGVKKKERREIAQRYLKMVELPGFGDRRVHELSGGQQQRVALARALAAEPSVLLLDEPFSALDENLRDSMRLLVKNIQKETGITTIMVTHDQIEALSVSTRIGMMDKGRIIQVGTPAEVYSNPAALEIADYFASECTVHGTVKDGELVVDDLVIAAPALDDGPAVAIIRKSDVSIAKSDGISFDVEEVLYKGQFRTLVLRHESLELTLDVPLEIDVEQGQQLGLDINWDSTLKYSEDID